MDFTEQFGLGGISRAGFATADGLGDCRGNAARIDGVQRAGSVVVNNSSGAVQRPPHRRLGNATRDPPCGAARSEEAKCDGATTAQESPMCNQ